MTPHPELPTPYGLRVLVQLDPLETTTATGLIVRNDKHTERNRGTVVSVGDDSLEDLVGRSIMFVPFDVADLFAGGEDYVLVPEDSIRAVFPA